MILLTVNDISSTYVKLLGNIRMFSMTVWFIFVDTNQIFLL